MCAYYHQSKKPTINPKKNPEGVGYGWDEFPFANFKDAQAIINQIGSSIGRYGNAIRRFKAIKKGDLIVVPYHGSIVIGLATGEEVYDEKAPEHGKNQQRVEFPRDEHGEVLLVPRRLISEGLQSRLKVRTSLTDLFGFRTEIERIFANLQTGIAHDYKDDIDRRAQEIEGECKRQLLSNIRNGRTNLPSGGSGLESLVQELLRIDGYEKPFILAKNLFRGSPADADIETSKPDRLSPSGRQQYLVQIKHHNGITSDWGIKQLEEIANTQKATAYENHQLVLITSGQVTEEAKEKARGKAVTVLDGDDLIEWIWDAISDLNPLTKLALGIADVPHILG
jgi:restriction system protein